MYINIESTMIKKVLEMIVTSKLIKIGYDLKNIYKISLANNINDFNNFQSDIKIAYYLMHSTENNYEIENIAYNDGDEIKAFVLKKTSGAQPFSDVMVQSVLSGK